MENMFLSIGIGIRDGWINTNLYEECEEASCMEEADRDFMWLGCSPMLGLGLHTFREFLQSTKLDKNCP